MEELLQRYIRGEASAEEKEQVIRWLDASPENRRQYMSLRKLYDISLWSVDEVKTKKRLNLRGVIFATLRYAAVLVVAFVGAKLYLGLQDEEIKMQTVFVPSGQRTELLLADGTKVWLNSRSTLRFPDHFRKDARNVELEGEGYFEVARDEKAPFTVQTDKYNVRVLGTEFNVKAYKDECFETALLKGCVEIQEEATARVVRMRPNELLSVNDGDLMIKEIGNPNYFRWREGLFCFDNERIGDLLQRLESYYDIKIEAHDQALLNSRYSGKFRMKSGIEHILRVLQLNHQFRYKIDEDKNLIIIK